MKLIFISLLIVNIAVAVIIQLGSDSQHVVDEPSLIAPEKIILLPKRVNCLEWGDFLEQDAQQAKNALADQDINSPLSLEFAKNVVLYWVYIPPFEDQQAANREINKLRNLGIASFRVQEQGPWLNAISFSMYHDRGAAQQLLRELQAKGVTAAKIKERNSQLQKIVIHEPDETIEIKLLELAQQYAGSKVEQATCERL
jgi:sporulation related protein